MARFSGRVGYATRVTTAPGVKSATLIERPYTGKYLNETIADGGDDKVHVDRSLSSRISVIADASLRGAYRDIKYVVDEEGLYWTVISRQLKRPRLILTTGGAYDGPKPSPTP